MIKWLLSRLQSFLSTPSARRATSWQARCALAPTYFYPRPPRGGRRSTTTTSLILWIFLSTPSARRATLVPGRTRATPPYFYPRPPRGGRPGDHLDARARLHISIHALREEGDGTVYGLYTVQIPISIHALREEGDFQHGIFPCCPLRFLSTPSARRATRQRWQSICVARYFYPRPPRGGRP